MKLFRSKKKKKKKGLRINKPPLTRIRWNPPPFHFSTASSPSDATENLILCFFIHVDKIAWLIILSKLAKRK
jgi:hypothetical protein